MITKLIQKKTNFLKSLIVMIMLFAIGTLPVNAADGTNTYNSISPYFNNISSAHLSIGFDENNIVYCSIGVIPYSNCTGISGIMKLFDSNGTCLAVWSVSDYERPIGVEFSHQGVYGETYTATFEGYAYSNNGTAPDRLEITVTDTCEG